MALELGLLDDDQNHGQRSSCVSQDTHVHHISECKHLFNIPILAELWEIFRRAWALLL